VVFITLDLFQYALLVDVKFDTTTHRMAARGRPGYRSSDRVIAIFIAPRFPDVCLVFHPDLLS
jgi:hypothetical protein